MPPRRCCKPSAPTSARRFSRRRSRICHWRQSQFPDAPPARAGFEPAGSVPLLRGQSYRRAAKLRQWRRRYVEFYPHRRHGGAEFLGGQHHRLRTVGRKPLRRSTSSPPVSTPNRDRRAEVWSTFPSNQAPTTFTEPPGNTTRTAISKHEISSTMAPTIRKTS